MDARVLTRSRSVGARWPMAAPALCYAALFGAVGAWFPFAAVLLSSRGLSLEAVGFLLALQGVVSLVAAPAWGSVADRTQRLDLVLLTSATIGALGAAWLAVARDPLPIAAALAMLAAGTAALAPLIDTRAVAIAGTNRERFSRARAWGSFAFVASSIVSGRIVADRSPDALFALFVPLLLITGFAGYLLLSGGDRAHGIRRGASAAVRPGSGLAWIVRRPGLFASLAGVGLVWTAVGAATAFIGIRIVDLGGDLGLVGLAFGVSAMVEVPLMLLFPTFARRAGASWLLVVGAAAFAARAAAWGLAPDPTTIVLASALGGVGFALFYIGVVSVVSAAVPTEAQATAQGLYSGMTFSLGTVVGSAVGGLLAPVIGLPALFLVSAGATGIAAAILARAMASVRRGVPERSGGS